MRIALLAVGRMKAGPERELLGRYLDRAQALARSAGLSGVGVREIDESRARSPAERRADEGRALAAERRPGGRLLALDERGAPVTSAGFASLVGHARDDGCPEVALAIGGPDGLDGGVLAAADTVLAYGAATFPHQLVRVMAAEQIYRALTILLGHPYHRA